MKELTEKEIEHMTMKFIGKNNKQVFSKFANSIKKYCHSDKWSITYDWMHDNFRFSADEDDGKIITKFVELVETNIL